MLTLFQVSDDEHISTYMDVWNNKSDTSMLDACLAGNIRVELSVPFAGERSVALEVRILPISLDQCRLYCHMGIAVGFMCSIF